MAEWPGVGRVKTREMKERETMKGRERMRERKTMGNRKIIKERGSREKEKGGEPACRRWAVRSSSLSHGGLVDDPSVC